MLCLFLLYLCKVVISSSLFLFLLLAFQRDQSRDVTPRLGEGG